MAILREELSDSTNLDSDILNKRIKEEDLKAKKCRRTWDKMYNGKVDLEVFQEEVKKIDESVYDMGVEDKVF